MMIGAAFVFVIIRVMDSVSRAAEVLTQAETNLKELVSKAAASGDYPGVVQIASWAQAVCDLLKKAPSSRTITANTAGATPARAHTPRQAVGAKKKTGRSPKDQYPKFFRHDDQLIRIAWSKKEKKEYQHKAPRAVIQALVGAVTEAGKDGAVFSTDNILPLYDHDGGEIPSYQAYVGISLLKHLKLIDQHGRQGYTVSAPDELPKAVEALWSQLPQR